MKAFLKSNDTESELENLRKRLLDLSARNRLINFRHSKASSLRVIDELPDQLVETLLNEKEMRFAPVPLPQRDEFLELEFSNNGAFSDIEASGSTASKIDVENWARHLGLSTSFEMPIPCGTEIEKKHHDGVIQTLLFPSDLESRLYHLAQKADSAIEESGSNILYLAFGFLEWFESTDSDQERIAPLFLVPVRLSKGKLNRETQAYDYTLEYSGEDIIPNLSLREKLRVDFALALPDLSDGTLPEAYFEEVGRIIRNNQPRWRILRQITLSLFNFNKLLMYLDLDKNRWPEGSSITDHPVVTQFLSSNKTGGPGEGYETNSDFKNEYAIDDLEDVHAQYPIIDDADASQHSALIDVVKGGNLVIEGPPGTGKSQTITNLIASAMAHGKKVLFVAEKLAALEVVKRRLDKAGLGDFCFELHSHKSQKSKVLDTVAVRLQNKNRYREPTSIDAEITRLEELKGSLKSHVERVNRHWKNTGKTLHDIFMSATRHRLGLGINPEKLHPENCDGDTFDPITQRRMKDQAIAFINAYRGIEAQLDEGESLRHHNWYGVRNVDLQIFDIERVEAALQKWQKALESAQAVRSEIGSTLDCDCSTLPDDPKDLEQLAMMLTQLPSLEGDEMLDCLPLLKGGLLDHAREYFDDFEKIQAQYRDLAGKIDAGVLSDFSVVDHLLTGKRKLEGLFLRTTEPGGINDASVLLKNIEDQCPQLLDVISNVQRETGEEASRHFDFSRSGLLELKKLSEIAESLPSNYWQFRCELFSNDEIDALLPGLRCEIEFLRKLREELKELYTVERIPDQQTLEGLRSTISAGGMFRWFKSDWRSARKQLLSYAASSRPCFKKLFGSLVKAIEFSGRLGQIANNRAYHNAFGKYFSGLETDLSMIESLRDWYRLVGQTYGIHFGPKVAIGKALIGLPSDLGRTLRSDEFIRQLNQFLNQLDRLSKMLIPVEELQSEESVLTGEHGLIKALLTALEGALSACMPVMEDDLSFSDLCDRIESIALLRDNVVRLKDTVLNSPDLERWMLLEPGLNRDNCKTLRAMRNTLRVATYFEHEIRIPTVGDGLREKAGALDFDELRSRGSRLQSALKEASEAYTEFEELVTVDKSAWMVLCDNRISLLIERNARALKNGEYLQNWLDYVRERNQLTSLGFGKIVNAIESGDLSIEHVETGVWAGTYDLLAKGILREEPELSRFSGRSQESIQKRYKHYDDRLKQLQRERIAWRIDQVQVPRGSAGGRVSTYTEQSLLEHECSKRQRHLPIRQLLKRASGSLVALKPCFMMSPMSVAQYLEPGQIEFDLVVMDEASQIKPEDALGAIARGRQLVVVGDPKQLPPTGFFDRVIDSEDEDPTAIEESESILDAALPVFPGRRLRWHYRSQHEALIAFSNHSFYDNDLVLFPSPSRSSKKFGLHLSRVENGCFSGRRNIEEARAISEAIREHLNERPEDSLGIVAMSADQREQIERAIESLMKEDPDFREKLERNRCEHESMFVKNLENVQGDERDVIYISLTYGPQELGGRVFQRFGPINSDSGWRRLNVLFTRSRKCMRVFTSMGSEDILEGPNSKRGVRALKNFLEYAETGFLPGPEWSSEREPDSDFEIAVINALSNEGFECVPQVGVAGFFIDIAVVDPGSPGRYVMGIECDGATYHSAKSVRDRDRLRQSILEDRGWRIRRIWSTDWFKNPDAELRPILRELRERGTHHSKPVFADFEAEVAVV